MGIFDFVKDAGAKLFGSDEEPEAGETPSSYEVARARRAEAMGDRLRTAIADHGLSTDRIQLDVDVVEGIVVVTGTVPTQTDREKVVLVVGNVAGVAQVDDRLEVDEPEPASVFHTVVAGDTLSKIAKAAYGDPMKYPVIFDANRPMLADPDLIYPGQVLRIPPLS